MSQIEKSPETLAREKKIQELEKELKRVRTTVKSLRTRLQNTREKVKETANEVARKTEKARSKTLEIIGRIRETLTRLLQDDRFDEDDRFLLQQFQEMIQKAAPPDLDKIIAEQEQQSRSEQQSHIDDFLEEMQSSPDKEEQKDIRKLYLKLSKRLHPDRASDKQEEARLHELQQQVIRAYERHDYQALSELWDLFGEEEKEPVPTDTESYTDVLQARIEQLQQEIELLRSQQERLSAEIKALRQSELGQMLTHVDSYRRYGHSLEESLGLDEQEFGLSQAEELAEQLEATEEKGELHPLFRMMFDFAGGPQGMDPYNEQGIGDQFVFDFDEDDFPEDLNPRFALHQALELTGPLTLEYFDESGKTVLVSVSGLSGWVEDFFPGDDPGSVDYFIRLDLDGVQKLPADYILNMLKADVEPERIEVEEEKLRRKKARPMNQALEEMRAVRKYILDYLYKDEKNPKIRALLDEVLLADPQKAELQNWMDYFEKKLPLPLRARTLHKPKGEKRPIWVSVLQPEADLPNGDLLLRARKEKSRKEIFVPLSELEQPEDPGVNLILEAYRTWMKADSPYWSDAP